MKKILLFFFFLSLVFLIAAQVGTTRYVSAWTPVLPGETVRIPHALTVRPFVLQVWTALPLANPTVKETCQVAFELVIPVYESEGLHVVLVNAEAVYLKNESEFTYCAQVFVQP